MRGWGNGRLIAFKSVGVVFYCLNSSCDRR
jgi:hypothetical protein